MARLDIVIEERVQALFSDATTCVSHFKHQPTVRGGCDGILGRICLEVLPAHTPQLRVAGMVWA